jgi:hypothetical protein
MVHGYNKGGILEQGIGIACSVCQDTPNNRKVDGYQVFIVWHVRLGYM